MRKILSIIIPTYNMEKYLNKCLDTLIVSDENMNKLEVLIINDGSIDSSSQIAHEYSIQYPGVFKVVDKENGNYGSCINRGLKEATGKYIKVLDADDYFDVDIFNQYIDFLTSRDEDLVISNFRVVDENDEPRQDYRFDEIGLNIFHLDDIPKHLVENLWHHAITYHRKVFNFLNYRQTEGISYTDDEWIFEPMINVKNVVCFPHILYLYLRGREGQTFDPKVIRKTLEQRRIVANRIISYYEQNDVKNCSTNMVYLTTKLMYRISDLYRCHLITSYSKDSLHQIKNFDINLKESSPHIYKELDQFKNKYGWRYIHQWRIMNYSGYAPAILLTRIKTKIQRKFKKEW